jgi:hypothetical protein
MESYTLTGKANIVLKVSCNVAILPSDSQSISVEVKNDSDNKVSVSRSLNTIRIEEKGLESGSINFFGGNIVMGSGNSISMTNGNINITGASGKVFVNGQEINVNTFSSVVKPIEIIIYAPLGTDVEADLRGQCKFASSVPLGEASIDTQGACQIVLECESLGIESSGSTKVKAKLKKGDLMIGISGSSEVEINGEFSNASVQISGSGRVYSSGICKGYYRASVSGSGRVSHQGTVEGKVRKSVSGSGSINI